MSWDKASEGVTQAPAPPIAIVDAITHWTLTYGHKLNLWFKNGPQQNDFDKDLEWYKEIIFMWLF